MDPALLKFIAPLPLRLPPGTVAVSFEGLSDELKTAPASPGMRVIYGGRFWQRERVAPIDDTGAGAGWTPCPECGGFGSLDYRDELIPCNRCKTAGRVLVMV